ncbi:unnamed protein product [Cyprideis torosa]|uniref:Uncharacterized protein n=1 Tax=Cyprideis torosa TaxID=163714 RepID=A0A7R8ZV22_9CRUS|nr:unnamed protein product [Cyprideis torosa]CAG0901598.1 unnamed protein product [Cyprideis torosa]
MSNGVATSENGGSSGSKVTEEIPIPDIMVGSSRSPGRRTEAQLLLEDANPILKAFLASSTAISFPVTPACPFTHLRFIDPASMNTFRGRNGIVQGVGSSKTLTVASDVERFNLSLLRSAPVGVRPRSAPDP